jgi:hypothetical protein
MAASLKDDRIPVLHQPAEQGPGGSVVSVRKVGCFWRPQIRVEDEWTGVVTASDLSNNLCASLVDQAMAQLHRCETRLQQRSSPIIKRPDAPASRMTTNADTCFKRLANLDQTIVNHGRKLNTAPRVETTHEICASASTALEQDKEQDGVCRAP